MVVHFAGDSASAYQLEQWRWPLEQLAQYLDVGILCRSARTARVLAAQTTLPVRFGRRMADLDAVLGGNEVRCVLYVNQSPLNFHALRYPRPAHIHMSHGESEKSSMVTNQLKAYDYVFTAGTAARERIASQLIGFADDRMIDVGRPQLDGPSAVPQKWTEHLAATSDESKDSRRVVFWAPTWEGDSPSMAYGTLPVSGPRLARTLISADAQIIYRPHPRTGFLDPQFRAADDELRALVEGAGGFVDTTTDIGWQFTAADACIAEMSAIAFDWLSTGKPLALIRPADGRADIVPGGLFSRVPSFLPTVAPEAVITVLGTLNSVLGDVVKNDSDNSGDAGAREQLLLAEASHYYLGDTEPGAQIHRFTQAIRHVVDQRERILSQDG
ncbi:CDP-glycerol glycerophosphotransferase family protein [Brevibacterium yomogidense]|uniref:CDP-glycerol glycerophosphotransferase family protein n=1 Tax=Brevibacterium yomogidense TaxID=946573 RepID=UPI0018E01806